MKNRRLLFSFLIAFLAVLSTNIVHADAGFDSVGDTNNFNAKGVPVMTLTGSSKYANFLGSVGVAGNQSVQGASSVAGDLSVEGSVHFKGPLEIGTEGSGSYLAAGTSESSPALLIGGATTNNTDPIYFQRYNENSDTSSLRLVIGDNYGQQYVPGGSTTAGDAFIIGSLNSSNSSYGFVPNFTFTSDAKLGIGTTTPKAALDVNGEARVGYTGLACSSTTAGAVRYNTGTNALEACNGAGWVNVTGGAYSAGGVDTVAEDNSGTFAYCRLAWGAASCDSSGNVSCTRGAPQITTMSHDNIGAGEVSSASHVSVRGMTSNGAQVNHFDCIVQ